MSWTASSWRRSKAVDTKTPARSCGPRSCTLERDEQEYEAKLAALRAAIDEGDAGGVAQGNPFERVRATLKLPRKRR